MSAVSNSCGQMDRSIRTLNRTVFQDLDKRTVILFFCPFLHELLDKLIDETLQKDPGTVSTDHPAGRHLTFCPALSVILSTLCYLFVRIFLS